jgi:phage tail sheath protein FI
MPTDYHHGVRVIEINSGTRPIRTVSTAIVGFVATAEDADALTFPLNTPVLITDVVAAQGKAGTSGTLLKVLQAIASQTKPVAVVVRVAEGATDAETTTNVIGTVTAAGKYTGMKALLAAKAQLGIKPRILGVPFLDTQPVATALATIAQSLRAFAYISANGAATKEEATTYRAQFSQREVMVIWPDWINWNITTSDADMLSGVAVALGLRAKIDEEIGWHKTLSNVGVNGVTGISKDVYFDLQSTDTDADYLNQLEVTTLINQTGYRFWGSRTCSDDVLFAFENYTRTAQVVADTIAEAHMEFVDIPLHPSIMTDVIASVNRKFRSLVTDGYLIGASAWYDPAPNTLDVLKSGKSYIDYDYTPVPPLENLVFQQRITDRYLVDFASRVTA